MAKKADATSATESPRRRVAKKEISPGGASVPASRSLQTATTSNPTPREDARPTKLNPSALLDTRVVYCGGQSLTGTVWGETKEKRAFEDRHENTKAYIDYMRPRCVQLARVLKKTGSFYYHCDWHASHYVNKVQGGDMGLDADSTNGYPWFQ
jgi:hypothetical protein